MVALPAARRPIAFSPVVVFHAERGEQQDGGGAGSKKLLKVLLRMPSADEAREPTFGEWPNVVTDAKRTIALLDRLSHHGDIIEIAMTVGASTAAKKVML